MAVSMTYGKQRHAEEKFEYRSQTCSWGRWIWGAILGIGGGIAAVAVGSVLTAIAWFTGAGSYVGTVGTILLIATIPLLGVGAQCLDIEEKRKKRARESRCDENR